MGKEFKLDMNNIEHVEVFTKFSKLGGIKTTIIELAGLVEELNTEAWEKALRQFPEMNENEEWIFDKSEKKFFVRNED